MPVRVLARDGVTNLRAWSIVGVTARGWVSHVALAAAARSNLSDGDKVPVYHMGPPLTAISQDDLGASEDAEEAAEGPGSEPPWHATSQAHLVAWLEDLSSDECRAMGRWHRKVSALFKATPPPRPRYRPGSEPAIARFFQECRYIAHPPYREERDPVSGNLRAIWFSCAGFVIRCYGSAAVSTLVADWSTAGFPALGAQDIRSIWFPAGLQWTAEIAAALNLPGHGPWPVVVPGYVVNAFRREDTQVRHEAFMPSRADAGLGSSA